MKTTYTYRCHPLAADYYSEFKKIQFNLDLSKLNESILKKLIQASYIKGVVKDNEIQVYSGFRFIEWMRIKHFRPNIIQIKNEISEIEILNSIKQEYLLIEAYQISGSESQGVIYEGLKSLFKSKSELLNTSLNSKITNMALADLTNQKTHVIYDSIQKKKQKHIEIIEEKNNIERIIANRISK